MHIAATKRAREDLKSFVVDRIFLRNWIILILINKMKKQKTKKRVFKNSISIFGYIEIWQENANA